MSTSTNERLNVVLSRVKNVQEQGDGYLAQCPAHDDAKNSLSIRIGLTGGIVMHCHANCLTTDIVAELGLAMIDLAPQAAQREWKEPVAIYPYRDSAGKLLYQACRFEPKTFLPRTPKDGGGWNYKLNGTARVLYRLPELLSGEPAQWVYVVEGEKDSDNLAAIGLISTTNLGGAGKWRPEYSESLRGRRVCVLIDNDPAGTDHGAKVSAALQGIASEIKVVLLPGLPPKGDVSDWLDAGGTVEQLLAMVEATPHADAKPAAKKRPAARLANRESGNGAPTLETENGRTEIAQMQRLLAACQGDVAYIPPQNKFYRFVGTHWEADAGCYLESMAQHAANELWPAAANVMQRVEVSEQTIILRYAKAMATARTVKAVVELLKPHVVVPIESFDRDTMALNVANGTLDLAGGKLRPHKRSDHITKISPVAFDASATCPIWLSTLDRIMAGKQSLIDFMQRMFGYCLTGSIQEHAFFFWYGEGSNGKSTAAQVLLELLGDGYGMKAGQDLFMVQQGGSHPTGLTDLFGKRMAMLNEVEDGKRLAESLLKDATGGDKIRARRMREDFWQFNPTHKIIMAGNHRPVVRGTDHGFWRRVKAVPFTVKIPDGEQDKYLGGKLRAEYPGILNWAIEGCRQWQRMGLAEPDEVKQATADYRGEMDVIGQFIDECCEQKFFCKAKASDLYQGYHRWAEAAGEHAVSQRKFGQTLTERGFQRTTNNGVWYSGIGLRSDDGTNGRNGT